MKCNTEEKQASAKEKPGEIVFSIGSLISYLARIKDTRKPQGMRYSLLTILVVMILAKLCGEDKPFGIADWAQMRSEWLIETLQLKYKRLPHHTTYRRILSAVVDGDEFEGIVSEYLSQLPKEGQHVVVSIDGKTIRGTITPDDPFGLHLLAAYLPGEGIVLMQMVVEKDKENEIVVAPNVFVNRKRAKTIEVSGFTQQDRSW